MIRVLTTTKQRGAWLSVFICVILFGASAPRGDAEAAERPRLPVWKLRRSALDQKFTVGEIRIFYSLKGVDALPEVTDANRNGTPDRIENIARQMLAARRLLVEALGLRHPLASPRYGGKARFIDVNVGALPFAPGSASGNGSAGDAVVNYYRLSDPAGGMNVLTIDISNKLSATNATPAHELFHLFQYSYTMFKNGWFLEGTARWSEALVREGGGKAGSLISTGAELKELQAKRYNASTFWIAMAKAADPEGALEIPADLRAISYVNGDPVIKDAVFYGGTMVKELLEALDKADDHATARYKLQTFGWKESRQRAPENDPYIWAATINVARRYADRSPALREMTQKLAP